MYSRKLVITFILVLSVTMVSKAQQPQTVDKEAQVEIAKLEFLTGNWKGTGWIYTQQGIRDTFDQTEVVQFKNEGTALLVEGRGVSKGVVIHNALAIITPDKEGAYNFDSYLFSGRSGNYKGEMKGENLFYWYPSEFIRYIITLNEKGQWFEKGEMKRGDNWFQFFEMTLDKLD